MCLSISPKDCLQFKGSIVVNTDSNKAAQLIVEDDYKVTSIASYHKGKKKGAGV